MTDTMKRASIRSYPLPGGYTLHEHYWFDQYGQIDQSEVCWSIDRDDGQFAGPYVKECHSYTEAMVSFLAQTNQKLRADSLAFWVTKLLETAW